jgi:hypothetical protein
MSKSGNDTLAREDKFSMRPESVPVLACFGILILKRVDLTFSFLAGLSLGLLLIICGLLTLYLMVRARWKEALSYCLPAVTILLLPLYGSGLDRLADIAELRIFPRRFESCARNSINYDQGQKFAICEYFSDSLFVRGRMVVYDSGGQVSRSPGAR